ncbi:MAG: TldD/PmbA family protein, partial [Candidatus Aenigmarchaeota archaeon]|nr:TldD/PmbA family protein [Candidatus Aenigmarchaeota archaeon]
MIKIQDTDIDTQDILKKAIDYAKSKSDYCDIRAIATSSETSSKTTKEESNSSTSTFGVGIRVLKDGAYAYTSCQKTDLKELKSAIDKASKIATLMSKKTKNKASQKTYKAITDTKKTKVKTDPFEIPAEQKHIILKDIIRYAAQKEIAFASARISASIACKQFANTEGSFITTETTKTILALSTVAKRGERQAMNYDVYAKPAGFETLEKLNLEQFANNIAKKAISFLDAVKPPHGKMDVIMSPQVAGTLVHEVFGHAAEADWIANGRSLLKDKLNMRIGTDIMTIYDDGSMDGGWGTIYYDDEGIPAKNSILLDKGILVQYMHSRQTAEKLGMELTGNARAQDYTHRIIPRMTNTCLAPGTHTIEEMIGMVKKGILVDKYT